MKPTITRTRVWYMWKKKLPSAKSLYTSPSTMRGPGMNAGGKKKEMICQTRMMVANIDRRTR